MILASRDPALRPRLELATGKFLARVAAAEAAHGDRRAVSDGAASWLAAKPVSLLSLDAAALRRLGDLRRIPFVERSNFLGSGVGRISRVAQGVDPAPVIAARPP